MLGADITVAEKLLAAAIKAGGSRHVVAAVASAMWRLEHQRAGTHPPDDCILEHEALKAVAEIECGRQLGIAELCKLLKSGGYTDLAQQVSTVHRFRKADAHPPCALQ